MTEQPAEPQTEQEWLQNDPGPLPEVPAHHYAPNAHRIPTAYLKPQASRDNTTVVILFNKSVAAAAQLIQASAASKAAEDALAKALAVENLADIDSVEADRQLLEYVRKEAGQ